MKRLAQSVIVTLIIAAFFNNSSAQQIEENVLKGIWESNIGSIVKIDGNQGILLYTPSELWKKYINKPIIRIIRQHYDSWVVEELIVVSNSFHWLEISWRLENNLIIKHLIYLKDEEKNYYKKISDELDYEISDIEKKPISPSYSDKFDITLGIGKLSGDTTYQIGGTVVDSSGSYELHFPISELEFPLDVNMISVEGSVEADIWKLSLCVQKEITDDSGDMKDSDWITPSDPSRLDIYSTSDAELDALILDINFRGRFYKTSNWSFIAGLGYLRENFDFKCRLKRQYSPSGLPGYDFVGDGSVGLIYEVTYNIPYMQIGAQCKIKDKLRLEASLGYSPIVNVKDKDGHLLRVPPIFAKGNCDGDAILFSFTGRYDFPKNWFLTAEFGYAQIDTDGTQKNYINGGWVWTTDETIESEQLFTTFAVGYEF